MKPQPNIDLQAIGRLLEQLEHDLARVQAGTGNTDTLRAEVEQLRALLARNEPAPAEVHTGLAGVRDRLHALGDELFTDAVKSGDYLARIGRLLGL